MARVHTQNSESATRKLRQDALAMYADSDKSTNSLENVVDWLWSKREELLKQGINISDADTYYRVEELVAQQWRKDYLFPRYDFSSRILNRVYANAHQRAHRNGYHDIDSEFNDLMRLVLDVTSY